MKTRTAFMLIALLGVVALAITGCGKLDQEEFEMWKNEHVSQVEKTNAEMSNKITMLDTKVDGQKADLMEAISEAKDESIAAAQQGDADTIAAAMQNAKELDAKLRADLAETAEMQAEKAMKAAKDGDAELHKQLMAEAKANKAQADEITKLNAKVMALEEQVAEVEMEVAAKPIVLTTIRFASGQTGLSSKAKAMLDEIVEQLMSESDAKIIVEGHADGAPVLRGTYRSNWDLSQARANSAAKYLRSKGIDASRIEAVGKAHTDPVASQTTSAGRAENRRVEVILLPMGATM